MAWLCSLAMVMVSSQHFSPKGEHDHAELPFKLQMKCAVKVFIISKQKVTPAETALLFKTGSLICERKEHNKFTKK